MPYQIVRFPMKVSSSFPQFNRKELDFGTDLDRDGVDERADAQGRCHRCWDRNRSPCRAGTFKDAVKVEARMYMQIHLSGAKRTVHGN